MKRILLTLITLIILAVLGFFGWYVFVRGGNVPVAETIRNILPFGEGSNEQATNPSTPLGTINQNVGFGKSNSNLFQISSEPVAGAVVLNRNASTTIVRYVDRATGHIYDVTLETLAKVKISNQTLPKIYEANFRPDGNTVLLRSLRDDSDVVENISLALTPTKTSEGLYSASSTALRGSIGSIAVGSGNNLFYTLEDSSTIVSSAFNGSGQKTLLKSPFRDWRLAVAGNNLLIYPKASAGASGVVYKLNTSGGSLVKVLGPFNGLTAISNLAGDHILYSYVESGKTRLFAKNLKNNDLSEILPTSLAEKCVWSAKKVGIIFCANPADEPEPGEPDNWYLGLTHFSDRFWIFDTNQDIAQVLEEPKQTLNLDIDAMDLKLSPSEDYLVFINKTDLSLWALKLEGI